MCPVARQVWIMAAHFEIRQHRLDASRQILGMALGSCPKDKLFKAYIDIEYSLGNMDRYAAILARPYAAFLPHAPASWAAQRQPRAVVASPLLAT